MKVLGKNIRMLRHQRGWSQEDVAAKLGISIPAFSKIETGITDVNLSRLEQIAKIFDLSVVKLLSNQESESGSIVQTEIEEVNRKLLTRDNEISILQRKVIELYEELRKKQSNDVV